MDMLNFNDENIKKEFLSKGEKLMLKRGDFFHQQGSICNRIAYIVNGRLKQYHERDGKIITLGFGYKGFITDYYSYLTEKESDFSIVAMSDCELQVYNKAEVDEFFNFNIETQRFGRIIAEQLLVSTQEALMSMMFETVEERYLRYTKKYPELLQMFSLKDIAESIGTTPETLSRVRRKIIS